MAAELRLLTASTEETRELGTAVAVLLRPGDLVSLTGDLGAGKTTLVQGACRALGVREPVVSPTFTLVRQYRGLHLVHHMDVYRLERIQDVIDLGFDEMLEDGGIVFVEWGDAIDSLMPDDHLTIELSLPEHGDVRRLGITGHGPSWAERWERLDHLTAAWRERSDPEPAAGMGAGA
jgi:tRNA threonylcarbamoyladenosine biosynthesis protein TsaE